MLYSAVAHVAFFITSGDGSHGNRFVNFTVRINESVALSDRQFRKSVSHLNFDFLMGTSLNRYILQPTMRLFLDLKWWLHIYT